MKIYQVHFGCMYEGGSTEIVYSTLTEARKYVLAKIKEDEEDWQEYYKKYPERKEQRERRMERGFRVSGRWTETGPNRFESGHDVYLIIETEVKEIFEEKDLKSIYEQEQEVEESTHSTPNEPEPDSVTMGDGNITVVKNGIKQVFQDVQITDIKRNFDHPDVKVIDVTINLKDMEPITYVAIETETTRSSKPATKGEAE